MHFCSIANWAYIHQTECLPGYYGDQCNKTCRHPNYGHNCQLNCMCEEDQCDPITGCDGKNCSTGYYGSFCNRKCRYPNYGKRCQSECLCGNEQCDHITGCVWKRRALGIMTYIPSEMP
uniref:Tyrosine-protein kinase receptor Tie-1 n=1 Tax=Magallana gigas TaxID=29159 RepID=K1R8D8_MAGGI